MKTTGKIKGISESEEGIIVSFELPEEKESIKKYENILLDISFSKHRNKRSLDANAMLWACLGELADALKTDNWSMYLYELERYGKFTHILVATEALESVKRQWRETKVVGEVKVSDPETGERKDMIQVICFFGSSTYNSKEFSRLLDGVISDMKDIKLETPADSEMKRIIEQLEKQEV